MDGDSDPVTLIGLDAASQPKNFGFAVGTAIEGRLVLESAGCLDQPGAIESIARAITRRPRCVIAVDAPLGWPALLGKALAEHRAGQSLKFGKDDIFKRVTDRRIAERLKQHPLEVAADKIARAAHSALDVLTKLRLATALPLQLLWPGESDASGVIEVYPAATLRAFGLPNSGYKEPKDVARRQELANAIAVSVSGIHGLVHSKADVFDAALCAWSALGFLAGRCVPPSVEELDLAKHEGWIWAPSRADT